MWWRRILSKPRAHQRTCPRRGEAGREALRDASILTHLGFSDAIPDEFVAGYEHGWEDYAAAIRALAEEEK
jgi:hypothetical protein